MISVSAFVERVEKTASRKLTYRTGGMGSDGTCDCIGLIMGAMVELGHKKYDMHSTNYFARYQTLELKAASIRELFVGQLLYRARATQDKLHARYLPGGRYFTGDTLDYYHVGVVTSIKPLKIIECTEYGGVSGIVIREEFKNWNFGGKLRGVLYEYEDEAGKAVETMISAEMKENALYRAVVSTQEGALNVRERPKTGTILGRISKGKEVEVLADNADGWLKIRSDELIGYASEEYLTRIEEEAESELPRTTALINDEDVVIVLQGRWRVAQD